MEGEEWEGGSGGGFGIEVRKGYGLSRVTTLLYDLHKVQSQVYRAIYICISDIFIHLARFSSHPHPHPLCPISIFLFLPPISLSPCVLSVPIPSILSVDTFFMYKNTLPCQAKPCQIRLSHPQNKSR